MMENIIIKKYFPKARIVKKVICKSYKEIAEESGLSKSGLYKLINGEHSIDTDKPRHAKALKLLEERSIIIEEAIKRNTESFIKIENKVYNTADINFDI